MKLVHYADAPLGALCVVPQDGDTHKPRGLWVSDDACSENWPWWCLEQSFRLDDLTHVHDVRLAPDANILRLASAFEIDALSVEYAVSGTLRSYALDWERMRRRYAGLIITPYVWQRRLDGDARWYYDWDCASGCIWDPAAIASVTLREVRTPQRIAALQREMEDANA